MNGDFPLVSSDGTIFFVPENVLRFNSKVFDDMFRVGAPSDNDTIPLAMQADAKHLEMILKLTHPSHVAVDVNEVSTLAELLRIAKQYEMDAVIRQLRGSFLRTRIENGVLMEPITVREPLAAFVVAISFDFIDEARFALGKVIECDLSQELGKAKRFEIPLYLMQYILDLRASRTEWLKEKVTKLTKLVITPCRKTITDSTSSELAREDALAQLTDCMQWKQQASQALQAQPTFLTLNCLVFDKNSGAIADGMFRGTDLSVVWELMASWEAKVDKDSAHLPNLEESLRI